MTQALLTQYKKFVNSILVNKQFLKDLLRHRNGLRVHSIHFVEASVLDQKAEDQLKSVGLSDLEPIYFGVEGLPYGEKGEHSLFNKRGCTISSMIGGQPEQVILILECSQQQAGYDDEFNEGVSAIDQLVTLTHELGHVKDLRSGKNSNFTFGSKPTVDLVEAEVYAHAYCLNHLNKIGASKARNAIAEALYRTNESVNPFDRAVYHSLCKRIGEERIKKWNDQHHQGIDRQKSNI